MLYFIAITIPLVLLVGFLLLVHTEMRTGKRAFAARRYLLDMKTERVFFVIRHVDWGAFATDVTRTSLERALHDMAHGSLMAVRALERALTRLVRTLRTRRDTPLPPVYAPHTPYREQVRAFLMRTVRRSRKSPVKKDAE